MRQYYQECIALGSKTGLSLVGGATSLEVEKIYHELWQSIFRFERQFSRFLPGSELSTFNRNASTKQFISQEFRALLVTARDLATETKGLYNPFILPALQKSGYKHSRVPGYENDKVDDHSNKSVVSIDHLEIGDDWARIPYGTALDLGGCGKGYIADQIKQSLPSTITGYWLSFGGDIAVGGRDDHALPWKVYIQSADAPDKNIGAVLADCDCGVATSGTIVHRGKAKGKMWHHIIDPRTCKTADTDVLLATVWDKLSVRADVLASCAVILGEKQGLAFLKSVGVKGALIQWKDNKKLHITHTGNAIMMPITHA